MVSGDTSLVRPPATVFIPAGATDADFNIATSAVSVPARVTIDPGTEADSGVHAFQISVVLTPPGSPTPAPSLSSLTLSQSSVLAGSTVTGTVRLTSPAPLAARCHIAGQHGRSGDFANSVTAGRKHQRDVQHAARSAS